MEELAGPGTSPLDLLTVAFMINSPLWLIRIITGRAPPVASEQRAHLMKRLRRGTCLAGLLWAALLCLAVLTGFAPAGYLAKACWTLFFPLWFGIANKILILDQESAASAPSPSTRTANLVDRGQALLIPDQAFWIASALLILLWLGLLIRGFLAPFAESDLQSRWKALTIAHAIMVAFPVLFGRALLRATSREPEPIGAAPPEALLPLYSALRKRRAQGLFALLYGMPLLFGSFFAILIWRESASGELLGLLGAAGGALMGIGGAVFGVAMARERYRIDRLRAQLSADNRANPQTS